MFLQQIRNVPSENKQNKKIQKTDTVLKSTVLCVLDEIYN